MRTLHFGLRVSDLDRSLAFYTGIGFEVVGTVPETGIGHLTMLKLHDDPFVTIELVFDPTRGAIASDGALSHFVITVDSLDEVIADLATHDITSEQPGSPDGSDTFRTTWLTDPDGNRIELVQWPPGHADGITAADWAE